MVLSNTQLSLLCALHLYPCIREYKKVIEITWESGTAAVGLCVRVHPSSQYSVVSSLLLIILCWAGVGWREIIYIWVSSAVNISAVQRVICMDTGCHYNYSVYLIVLYRVRP